MTALRVKRAREDKGERGLVHLQPAVEVYFSLQGALRFCSHHDLMRTFRRALVRSGLPVRFSRGYNPQPRISLPVPRNVGMACECDCLRVYLERVVSGDEVEEKLGATLPQGLNVVSTRLHLSRRWPEPTAVVYSLAVGRCMGGSLQQRLAELQADPKAVVIRRGNKHRPGRTFVVRDYLRRIQVVGDKLTFTLRIDPQGSLTVSELLDLLHLPRELAAEAVRSEIQWARPGSGEAEEAAEK